MSLSSKQIEANLLYSFLPELKTPAYSTGKDSAVIRQPEHLRVLLDFIESTYARTSQRLDSLLRNNEITYDLLWTLFKPNSEIYTTCTGTDEPMCVRMNHGEEKQSPNGTKYFYVECRRFDNDGKIFGEATVELGIEKFRGSKRIELLPAFPLQYHQHAADVRKHLIDCGRKFLTLMGTAHHKHYEGYAFRKDDKGRLIRTFIKSRIMVDVSYFHHVNPNYGKPQVDEQPMNGWPGMVVVRSDEKKADIRNADVEADDLEEADLLACSPTVPGFSLEDKQWRAYPTHH